MSSIILGKFYAFFLFCVYFFINYLFPIILSAKFFLIYRSEKIIYKNIVLPKYSLLKSFIDSGK